MMYKVRQGECLSSIADAHGLFWESVWNLPENQPLRDKGRDPNVLLPGDEVFLPDLQPAEFEIASGATHTFKKKGIPTLFKLKLLDGGGQPRGNVPYTLEMEGHDPKQGKSKGDGTITEPVPPSIAEVVLTLNAGTPEEEIDRCQMRALNPADDVAGAQARLLNLGVYAGEVTGLLDEPTRAALCSFQFSAGLAETGAIDEATAAALVKRHGI